MELAIEHGVPAFGEDHERLPARTAQAFAPRVAALPPAGPPRILVVDNDKCTRGLVRLHLSNAGYQVEVAEDPVIAMKSIMRRPPSLMIVDVDMPYMNGLEFVEAVKSDSTFSGIAVMFLTARTDIEERAYALGALACLIKPLLAPRLICAVAATLPNGRFANG